MRKEGPGGFGLAFALVMVAGAIALLLVAPSIWRLIEHIVYLKTPADLLD